MSWLSENQSNAAACHYQVPPPRELHENRQRYHGLKRMATQTGKPTCCSQVLLQAQWAINKYLSVFFKEMMPGTKWSCSKKYVRTKALICASAFESASKRWARTNYPLLLLTLNNSISVSNFPNVKTKWTKNFEGSVGIVCEDHNWILLTMLL